MHSIMRSPNSCGICGLMGHNRRNCRIQRLRDEGEQMGTPLTSQEEERVRQELRREFNSTPQGIRWAEHVRQITRRAQLSQEQRLHIIEAREREARQRQAREQQAAQQREAQQREAQQREAQQQAARQQADFERFEQLEEQARQRLLAQQIQQEARAQQGDINISHTFNQLHSWLRRAERETTNRIRQSQTQQIPKSLSLKMVSDFSGYQEQDSKCCICYENDPIVGLPCRHSFCGECTVKFAKKNQNCPLCRHTFNEVHIPCNITPENFNKISCKLIL